MTRQSGGCLLATLGLMAALQTGTRAQLRVIPEEDRWVKLGSRIEPLPAGEGGQLAITAPASLCAADRLLEVRFFPRPALQQPVIRIPAPASSCRWTFEGMAEGEYDATIQVQGTGEIVGTAHGRVIRGAAAAFAIEPLDVEIEGTLTFAAPATGSAASPRVFDGLRLLFLVDDMRHYEWAASVLPDGRYRVKIGGTADAHAVCVRLERTQSMNTIMVKCGKLAPGAQHLDLPDVHVPPGLIRIEIPPDEKAAYTAFVHIEVGTLGKDSDAYLSSFKVLRGFRGEFMAEHRPYEIRITAEDRQTVLTSANVTISPEQPVANVTLKVPTVPTVR